MERTRVSAPAPGGTGGWLPAVHAKPDVGTPTCASLSQLNPELLEGVVAYIARKYHLSWQDTDDLRSALWVKVLDRDGIVLRRFAGRSTLFTYLVRVASRLILDNYTARYGRWRPSAKVRRLGPAAVEWARMIERDGWSPEHARAAVGAKERVNPPREPSASPIKQ